MIRTGTFSEFAPRYRDAGFWPRPITPGSKACLIKKWSMPDTDRTMGELNGWLESYGDYGIGLQLGSLFPDGSKLAAVDIDHDDYMRVTEAILGKPVCGRFGAKGIAYLVRLLGDGKYRTLKSMGNAGEKVGEILCDNRLLVLPPTIHPTTEQPYRWIGRPLLEVSYNDLPVIEA